MSGNSKQTESSLKQKRMRTFLFIVCACVISYAGITQPPLLWQKCLGGTGDDYSSDIIQVDDGGFLMAGHTYSNYGDVIGNHGDADYWIVKLQGTAFISEDSFLQTIRLYPMPSNDFLWIDIPGMTYGTRGSVFTPDGKKYIPDFEITGVKTCLDIRSLPAGIYVLGIGAREQGAAYRRFVVYK
jgi:hypothetical protein